MSRSVRATVAMMCILTLAGGCVDREARRRQQAQQQLEQAAALIVDAQRGYVDSQSTDAASVAEFRQRRLNEAAGVLEQVLARGAADQQAAARRMLVNLHESFARHRADQAQARLLALGPAGTELLRHSIALSAAQTQAASINVEQAPTLEGLAAHQQALTARVQETKKERAELGARVGQVRAEHQAVVALRDRAMLEARNLRDQAFSREGQAQYELYMQALAAERVGQQHDAQAEQIAVRIAVLETELALVDTRLTLAEQAAKTVSEQIEAAGHRQAQAREQLQSVLSNAANPGSVPARAKTLLEAFSPLDQAFAQDVLPLYVDAISHADKALDLAQQAAGDRRGAELAALGAQATALSVFSDAVTAVGGLGRSYEAALAALAHRPELTEAAAPIRSSLDALRQQQAQWLTRAAELAKAATEKAGQLAASPSGQDGSASLAGHQAARIQALAQRLQQADLAAPQAQ